MNESIPNLCRGSLPRFDAARIPVVELFGLRLHRVTLEETVQFIRLAATRRQRLFLSTVNVNFLALGSRDPEFRSSLEVSDLCVADGWPLVALSRRVCADALPERVAGADLFERLQKDADATPLRLYFFGGPPGVAEEAARAVNARAGGLVCVGHASPGYGDVASMSGEGTIEHINASGADLLVVALGALKGQAWIMRNLGCLTVPVISHWGAVVNFAAGRIRRAPPWVARLRLEWLWRIAQEPSLWRRYAQDVWCLGEFIFGKRWVGHRHATGVRNDA